MDYFDNPVAAADTPAVVERYIAVAAVGIVAGLVAVVVVDCQYAQNLTWRHESQ